jgi:hypothetical protein
MNGCTGDAQWKHITEMLPSEDVPALSRTCLRAYTSTQEKRASISVTMTSPELSESATRFAMSPRLSDDEHTNAKPAGKSVNGCTTSQAMGMVNTGDSDT